MSESNTGFDWFSVLAILVAGGISVVKAMSNKSKQRTAARSRGIPEYREEHEEYTESGESMIDDYTNPYYKEQDSEKPILGGDYYSASSDISAEDNASLDLPEESEQRHADFDLRQAIISSEILRRPQY